MAYNEKSRDNLKKPWEKGGPSPNSGGRPRYKPITDAIKAALIRKVSEHVSPQTLEKLPKRLAAGVIADLIADRLVNEAITGEQLVRACREIMDRVEGRVPLPLIGSSDEPVAIIINSHIPRPDRSKKKPAAKAKKPN